MVKHIVLYKFKDGVDHQEAKTHFFHLLDSRVVADYEL